MIPETFRLIFWRTKTHDHAAGPFSSVYFEPAFSFNQLAGNLVSIRLKNIKLLIAWKKVDTEATVSTDSSVLPDYAEVLSLEKYYISGGLLVLLFFSLLVSFSINKALP